MVEVEYLLELYTSNFLENVFRELNEDVIYRIGNNSDRDKFSSNLKLYISANNIQFKNKSTFLKVLRSFEPIEFCNEKTIWFKKNKNLKSLKGTKGSIYGVSTSKHALLLVFFATVVALNENAVNPAIVFIQQNFLQLNLKDLESFHLTDLNIDYYNWNRQLNVRYPVKIEKNLSLTEKDLIILGYLGIVFE